MQATVFLAFAFFLSFLPSSLLARYSIFFLTPNIHLVAASGGAKISAWQHRKSLFSQQVLQVAASLSDGRTANKRECNAILFSHGGMEVLTQRRSIFTPHPNQRPFSFIRGFVYLKHRWVWLRPDGCAAPLRDTSSHNLADGLQPRSRLRP
jgi:hypothetical protein